MSSKTKTKPAAKAKVGTATRDNKAKPKKLSAEKQAKIDALASTIECETIAIDTVIDLKARKDEAMDKLLAEMDEAAIDASLLDAEDIETVSPIDAEAVYASMKSELSVGEEVEDVAPKSGKKAAKAKRQPTKSAADAATPRVKVDIERLKSLVGESEATRIIGGVTTLPVKIRDKAINAVAAITGSGRMSGYTVMAIEHLRKSEGNATTSKGMIDMFLERKYKQGTAQAQAQQQMVLLTHLGITERDGRSLKLRTGNPLLAEIAA